MHAEARLSQRTDKKKKFHSLNYFLNLQSFRKLQITG